MKLQKIEWIYDRNPTEAEKHTEGFICIAITNKGEMITAWNWANGHAEEWPRVCWALLELPAPCSLVSFAQKYNMTMLENKGLRYSNDEPYSVSVFHANGHLEINPVHFVNLQNAITEWCTEKPYLQK